MWISLWRERVPVNSFCDDLFQVGEGSGITGITHTVPHMNTRPRAANQTAVTSEMNAPLLAFWHCLQTLQLVSDLAAAKEGFKNKSVAIRHNLSNFFLHQQVQCFFIKASANDAVS